MTGDCGNPFKTHDHNTSGSLQYLAQWFSFKRRELQYCIRLRSFDQAKTTSQYSNYCAGIQLRSTTNVIRHIGGGLQSLTDRSGWLCG